MTYTPTMTRIYPIRRAVVMASQGLFRLVPHLPRPIQRPVLHFIGGACAWIVRGIQPNVADTGDN